MTDSFFADGVISTASNYEFEIIYICTVRTALFFTVYFKNKFSPSKVTFILPENFCLVYTAMKNKKGTIRRHISLVSKNSSDIKVLKSSYSVSLRLNPAASQKLVF